MYNKVILVGNLTRDIELKYSPNGTAIGKSAIATNRIYKDATTGETKQETMFIDITIFGRSAEIANQYLKRGSKVLIEGRLVFEQWISSDGTKRSKHSVVVEKMQFMDTKKEANNMANNINVPNENDTYNTYKMPNKTSANQNTSQYNQQNTQKPLNNDIPSIDIDEEDIPF